MERFFQEDSTSCEQTLNRASKLHSSRLENQKEDGLEMGLLGEQVRYDHKLESVFHPTILKERSDKRGWKRVSKVG